jgi:histidinol-phosphate aminotransferase
MTALSLWYDSHRQSNNEKTAMTLDILQLLRRDIASFAPYSPIVPLDILAQQLGLHRDQLIKLDANENPYGPTAATRAALATLTTPEGARDMVALYPDPDNTALRTAIAQHLGQAIERIICGNGSDELIDLLLRATISPGEAVIDVTPSFGMYAYGTLLCQGKVVDVPRDANFDLDIDAIRAAITTHHAKIIFLAAPNNPTGNPLRRDELIALLDLPLIVVADEASAEFSGITYLDLIDDHPNLVVLRTFSKWAGLAGLRVGYGVMHESLATQLRKVKQPYTVNVAAEIAATAAVYDFANMQPVLTKITQDRDALVDALTAMGCSVYPSVANFVLVKTPIAASQVRDVLRKNGILIRYFAKPRLNDAIRISIGTPSQHERLLDVLQQTFSA